MIGQLRHKITLQSKTDTPDTMGGSTTVWATHAEVWAGIEPVKAQKDTFAEKRRHTITHRITIRARDDLTSAMRVSWNGRVFQIHGFWVREERGRWAILNCEEGVAS